MRLRSGPLPFLPFALLRTARWRRLALLIWLPVLAVADSTSTPLDRYVETPDPSYKYKLVKTIRGREHRAYVLDMTSQSWRNPSEVNRTEWRHWLIVIRPKGVRGSTGLLFIGGGSNADKAPKKVDPLLANIAVEAKAVVAELRMVPNQPLSFSGDTKKERIEDEMVAYTWDKFLRTGDALWPARLPMTKSAVRAMDSVTAFCGSLPSGLKVDRFVVAGGSKRGWTTWTTAAVDRRVVAIMPLVIDMLNLEKSFVHQWQAYGAWAPAVKDYVDLGIMERMGTPQFRALMKIEEPYEYRERFTMPKYMVNASGDEFFLPDSSQFYFDDLPGEKYLRYVPNTNHSLKDSDVIESITAFFQSVLAGAKRPQFSWKLTGENSVLLETVDKPAEVKLWQASNPKARDFRLDTIGPVWKSTALNEREAGVYEASVPKPRQGWTAFFVELTYPGPGKHPLKFTTRVHVVPDLLPYPPPASRASR